jgi:hypothetical protein
MYGLPQAGKLSQTRLIRHLSTHEYIQCANTPCLFRLVTRDIMFSLVVDNFGVRYTNQCDADHLIQTLEANAYKLKVRPLGDAYLGMAIAFDRARKTVSLSMPGYVTKMLQRFRPQYLLPGHRAAKTRALHSVVLYQYPTSRIRRHYRQTEHHAHHGTSGNYRHAIALR